MSTHDIYEGKNLEIFQDSKKTYIMFLKRKRTIPNWKVEEILNDIICCGKEIEHKGFYRGIKNETEIFVNWLAHNQWWKKKRKSKGK